MNATVPRISRRCLVYQHSSIQIVRFSAVSLFCLVTLFPDVMATPPGLQKTPWQHIEDDMEVEPKVPGVVKFTDNACVVTMPSGQKYTTTDKVGEATLILPNGQRFTAEVDHAGFGAVFVNDDETLIGAVLVPFTQSGEVHIYAAKANGIFREISDANEKIYDLLEEAKAPFKADALRLIEVKGRRFTLFSLTYDRTSIGTSGWLFDIEVGRDGTLTLPK